jgi:hypothetical protein
VRWLGRKLKFHNSRTLWKLWESPKLFYPYLKEKRLLTLHYNSFLFCCAWSSPPLAPWTKSLCRRSGLQILYNFLQRYQTPWKTAVALTPSFEPSARQIFPLLWTCWFSLWRIRNFISRRFYFVRYWRCYQQQRSVYFRTKRLYSCN